jgi:hypothetical protein
MSQPTEASPEAAEALLRGPVAEDAPGRRWAYEGKWAVLLSLFVLYHLVALLQHTTPAGGLAQRFNRQLGEALRVGQYMRATSSVQSWAMFAPNPHRTNQYLQVRVVAADGTEYDLLHDIYGRRDFPYFFYDRMGKINRRLLEQERYQKPYAAWVCRDWALNHGGQPPVRVNFTKMWTKLPHPSRVIKSMGFDPFQLKLYKEDLPGHECATLVHGQLPNWIRERRGLPPIPEDAFREVSHNTWWDRAQTKQKILERRRAAGVGREPREVRDDEPPPTPEVAAGGEGGGD